MTAHDVRYDHTLDSDMHPFVSENIFLLDGLADRNNRIPKTDGHLLACDNAIRNDHADGNKHTRNADDSIGYSRPPPEILQFQNTRRKSVAKYYYFFLHELKRNQLILQRTVKIATASKMTEGKTVKMRRGVEEEVVN
jgi:hypothetical protein